MIEYEQKHTNKEGHAGKQEVAEHPAIREAEAGKEAWVKQHNAKLKAGKASGITNEFGKLSLVADESGNGGGHGQTTLEAWHAWRLNLKNGVDKAPDGGVVYADVQGRINKIVDVNGKVTFIEYNGNDKKPSKIRIGGGPTMTFHGDHYGIVGEEGQFSVALDQVSGVISWTNKNREKTFHFPSGGIMNKDARGCTTSIIDAQGNESRFDYDYWPNLRFPSSIKLGFHTGEPVREFRWAGDMEHPFYYPYPNSDIGGGKLIGIAIDERGNIYMASGSDAGDITDQQSGPTIKVYGINGKEKTVFEADGNILPKFLRIMFTGKKL